MSVSPNVDIKSEKPEILQENLGNLIRGKEHIKKEKFSTVYKSCLGTQWKSNKNFPLDKNSGLAVDKLTKFLLQSKENQFF